MKNKTTDSPQIFIQVVDETAITVYIYTIRPAIRTVWPGNRADTPLEASLD
jgi:hypothetical protein